MMYRGAVNPPVFDSRLREYTNGIIGNDTLSLPANITKATIPYNVGKPSPITQSQMNRMVNSPSPPADERLDDYLNDMEINDTLEHPVNKGSDSSIQYMPSKPAPLRKIPYLTLPVGR